MNLFEMLFYSFQMTTYRYSLQTLENINAAISSGDYELAMTFAQSYLARLPMLNVADKPRLLANLYCSMGECGLLSFVHILTWYTEGWLSMFLQAFAAMNLDS